MVTERLTAVKQGKFPARGRTEGPAASARDRRAMMSPVSGQQLPPPYDPSPAPGQTTPAFTVSGGPRRRVGCLKLTLILAGGAFTMLVVVLVVGWLILQSKKDPAQSGDAVGSRPVGPVAEAPVPTSIPPGAEAVAPLPKDKMLVSVADNPAIDPCGGSGPTTDVMRMSTKGGEPDPLVTDRALDAKVNTPDDEIWARISPDRRRFVFYRTPVGKTGEHCRYYLQELWIANVDGTGVRKVFSNQQRDSVAKEQGWPVQDSIQGHADWSPDGRHVVMVLGHAPLFGPIPLLNLGETQLFTFDVDTGDLQQVTQRRDAQGRGLSSDPSYTPDGSTIVFVGCPDNQPICDRTQILSVPADGRRLRTTSVVFVGDRGANDVYVSPDGRSISWMEVGLLETKLWVAPFQLGKRIATHDRTLVDAHGGYANWTVDSRHLIYGRLWITDRGALFSNGFNDSVSQRISPSATSLVFGLPSP